MIGGCAGFLIGIWLMASPAALGYQGIWSFQDHIAGPLAASVSIVSLASATRPWRHALMFIGLWLPIFAWGTRAPWQPLWSELLSGAALIVLAALPAPRPHRRGGGWLALLRPGAGTDCR